MGMYSKYHSRKVTVDGVTYASLREYRRFCELKLLEKADEIRDLQRQVPFELIPAQFAINENGKRKCIEKSCVYKADFMYYKPDGSLVVEDSKGVRTKDYIIKRKLMLWKYGIKIHEV